MKYILLAFIIFSSFLAKAQNSYFVSTTGDDNLSGNMANPWNTIQYGCNQLAPGDTLNILGGTYMEKFYLDISGTAGNMITIRAFEDDTVIVDVDTFTTTEPIFNSENTSYYRLEGIHFTNFYDLVGTAGIFLSGYGHFIEIIDCKLSNICISRDINHPVSTNTNIPVVLFYGDSPTDSMTNILVQGLEIFNCRPGFSECLSIGGNATDFEFSENYIHNNANIAIDVLGNYDICPTMAYDNGRRGVIKNNHCHDNISTYASSAGVYVDGGYDVIIENNYLHHNGYGVEIGCEETGSTKNVICRNNIIYLNHDAGIALGGYDASTGGFVDNSKVFNNTFYKNDSDGNYNGELLITEFRNGVISNNIFYISSQNFFLANDLNQPNFVMDYNLVFSDGGASNIEAYWDATDITGLSNIYSTIGIGAHDSYGDPKFHSPTLPNLDFHLLSTSPAIDAGDPNFAPASGETEMDIEARIFNSTVDCGADETRTCSSANAQNTFTNKGSGLWLDARNWSMNTIPNNCQDVIIPSSELPSILANEKARCFHLDIKNAGHIQVSPNAELIILGAN